MSESIYDSNIGYQPADPIEVPPLYFWPPKPLKILHWIFNDLLFPWGYLFIMISFLSWYYLTPDIEKMSVFEFSWIAKIWFRNAVLLMLVAGGLHWWLYIRRSQNKSYKYNSKWLATGRKRFLWNSQVKDNMFWSIVSGCTVWTLYEAVTYWLYASGYVKQIEWSESPVYLTLILIGVFFWSTFHFYLNHRLLHWKPLYELAHELHHRNVNTGPWSGISMHPLEHIIYFSVFVLWWFVPVHPAIVLLTGIYQGISPSVSHSGFDKIEISRKKSINAGDQFHHLHHKYFEVNYGNTPTPMDKLFGTWHDGTPETHKEIKVRLRPEQY